MEQIKQFFVWAYQLTQGWLTAIVLGASAMTVALVCLFTKKRSAKVSAAVLVFYALLFGAVLCSARLSGVGAWSVAITACLVAAFFFALWMVAVGCESLRARRQESRQTKKAPVIAELQKKLDKKPKPQSLKSFVPVQEMGERAKPPLPPLYALPRGEEEEQSFGKEHAKHLISLLKSAPLTPADAREVDDAERAILGADGSDCLTVGQSLSTLVRLVARYGV